MSQIALGTWSRGIGFAGGDAESILAEEGVHISAIQNHFSLLYRSSEEGGILDYCKEHHITFFAYMVLEQGALSGKYDTKSPLPEGRQRATTYNPILADIEALTQKMKKSVPSTMPVYHRLPLPGRLPKAPRRSLG